jgi:pimeloyl-ACP methyl ester carboxylesterase
MTKSNKMTDAKAAAQLVTQATIEVTNMAESVHRSILDTLHLQGKADAKRTPGITGFVYQSVRSIAQLVGKGFDQAALKLEPLFEQVADQNQQSYARQAVVAALNGVMGDKLKVANNSLALDMSLHCHAQHTKTDKVVVLIHGLCMNDLQWRTEQNGLVQDHGLAIEAALGYTPIYVRYNTGLAIADNGQLLSQQLQQFQAQWPVPITEIVIVAHSMGGLVSRYAIEAAANEATHWITLLTRVVFLGTPHTGAPLERAGKWIEMLLGATPYSAPFTKLTKLRSTGITDLRYGIERNLPLPENVKGYAIAACTAKQPSDIADPLVGDGLVPLHSALGLASNKRASASLQFAPDKQQVFYRMNHMGLLRSDAVAQQVIRYLS